MKTRFWSLVSCSLLVLTLVQSPISCDTFPSQNRYQLVIFRDEEFKPRMCKIRLPPNSESFFIQDGNQYLPLVSSQSSPEENNEPLLWSSDVSSSENGSPSAPENGNQIMEKPDESESVVTTQASSEGTIQSSTQSSNNSAAQISGQASSQQNPFAWWFNFASQNSNPFSTQQFPPAGQNPFNFWNFTFPWSNSSNMSTTGGAEGSSTDNELTQSATEPYQNYNQFGNNGAFSPQGGQSSSPWNFTPPFFQNNNLPVKQGDNNQPWLATNSGSSFQNQNNPQSSQAQNPFGWNFNFPWLQNGKSPARNNGSGIPSGSNQPPSGRRKHRVTQGNTDTKGSSTANRNRPPSQSGGGYSSNGVQPYPPGGQPSPGSRSQYSNRPPPTNANEGSSNEGGY